MFVPFNFKRQCRLFPTISALALSLLVSPLTGAFAQGTNLLTNNPSFEKDTFGFAGHGIKNIQGWELEYYSYNGFGMRYRSTDEHPTDGDWLFYMDTGARATTAADSRALVTPGRTYKFTFDTTAYDDNTGQLLGTTPYILFYDASGNILKEVAQMDVQVPNPAIPSYNIPWGTYSVTAIAPPDAVKAGVQIITDRGQYPNNDRRWTRIDNIRLTLVPETKSDVALRRFPRVLHAGKEATVTVHYVATGNSNVLVRLLRGNLLVGQATRTVPTGRGTLDIPVSVPITTSLATNYNWEVRLQPTGTRTISARKTATGIFLDDSVKTGSTIAPDNPNLLYPGRWDRRNPKTPTSYWPQSQIQARFTGTSLTMQTHKAGFETQDLIVVVDGDDTTPHHVSVPFGDTTVTLISGLTDGIHNIVILQNSENPIGAWEVRGFQTDAGRGLLKPEPLPTRRIEIYGDSISAGGVPDPIVPNPNPDNDSDYSGNIYHTFGAFTARALGADYRSVAKGGIGVAGGFVSYTMLDIYDKWTFDGYNPAGAALWDFQSWQPDAVLVGIGHNDQFGNNADFIPNYSTLIRNLRTRYPNAEIFCTNTSMTPNARHFLAAFLPLMNDPKVHFQLFRPYQYHGGHPRLNDHQQMANGNADWNGLADWIGDTMGW